jgi:hypothetical protein
MPMKRHLLLAASLLCASTLALGQEDEAEPTASPEEQFGALLEETAGLKVYNDILEKQIANQNEDLAEIKVAIEQVPNLERQIPPLLTRIVDGLERFIELDLPFLVEERQQRLEGLKALIESTQASNAEKFRRVMEAWQIENEYGRTYTASVEQIELDGATREVDMLRLGRVGLIYQTTDEEGQTGIWDSRSNQWVEVGSQNRNSVRQALRMARNQVAPDIVLVPIIPPQN